MSDADMTGFEGDFEGSLADFASDLTVKNCKQPYQSVFLPDHSAKRVTHYQYPFHYSFQNTNTPPDPHSIPEVNNATIKGKRLDPYGPDRKDAATVNWGIDNDLWQTKQELTAFRIAFIAYIPLVAKFSFSWVNEPIPYVRSTIKKAIKGDNEAQTTLIDLWIEWGSPFLKLPNYLWMHQIKQGILSGFVITVSGRFG